MYMARKIRGLFVGFLCSYPCTGGISLKEMKSHRNETRKIENRGLLNRFFYYFLFLSFLSFFLWRFSGEREDKCKARGGRVRRESRAKEAGALLLKHNLSFRQQ